MELSAQARQRPAFLDHSRIPRPCRGSIPLAQSKAFGPRARSPADVPARRDVPWWPDGDSEADRQCRAVPSSRGPRPRDRLSVLRPIHFGSTSSRGFEKRGSSTSRTDSACSSEIFVARGTLRRIHARCGEKRAMRGIEVSYRQSRTPTLLGDSPDRIAVISEGRDDVDGLNRSTVPSQSKDTRRYPSLRSTPSGPAARGCLSQTVVGLGAGVGLCQIAS